MPEFKFIPIPNLNTYVILAPKRAKRPDIHKGKACVFCPGADGREEFFRIGGEAGDDNWQVHVIPNKYPFAPIHELVILTPVHTKHFTDLPPEQVRLGIEAYVNRYNTHKSQGSVCIFGNSGREAGESISHPHAQIAVLPPSIKVDVPKLEQDLHYRSETFEVGQFHIMCPPYSQWPDEVWIVPQERGRTFGEIRYDEIENLAFIVHRLVKIFELRHGHKLPHNFYIYPYKDWYWRITPRAKTLGGFEIATNIFVNTQDPAETMHFIKEHFADPEEEKIRKHRAKYRRGV